MLKSIYALPNQHDKDYVDIYTRSKVGEIMFGTVHIDLFYNYCQSAYDLLKQNKEVEIKIDII